MGMKGLERAPSAAHEHDPGRALPNTRLRYLLLATEAILTRSGLLSALHHARLHRYSSQTPPNNRALQVYASEYAALLAAIKTYYGTGARGILVRIGRESLRQQLRAQSLRTLMRRMRLLTQSSFSRPLTALRWVAEELAYPGGRVEASREGDRMVLCDYESDAAFGHTRSTPACWLTIGMIEEALSWATGREYVVTEVSCKAGGNSACRFEVGW